MRAKDGTKKGLLEIVYLFDLVSAKFHTILNQQIIIKQFVSKARRTWETYRSKERRGHESWSVFKSFVALMYIDPLQYLLDDYMNSFKLILT